MESNQDAIQGQLAIRRANRERKRKQRAREKARSDRAIRAYIDRQHAAKINIEVIARRIHRNICVLGEVSPGVDAQTVDEALAIAREFARALTVPDVQHGESLLDFERRVFEAWIGYDKFVGRADAGGNSPDAGGHAPYLNRETGELFPGLGKTYWVDHCGGFEKCWTPIPGAKELIDIESLPKLKKVKPRAEPKPEPQPVPPPRVVVPQQPNAASFAWIPPHAHGYLTGSGGSR